MITASMPSCSPRAGGAPARWPRLGLAPWLLAWALAFLPPPASAHKASDAYLRLQAGPASAELRLDVALRDLDLVIDLDADADGALTWGEIRAAWPQIDAYVQNHLKVPGCRWRSGQRGLEQRSDGVYAALNFNADCRIDARTAIDYRLLADVDATHRGLLRLEIDGQPVVLRVLDPGGTRAEVAGDKAPRGEGADGRVAHASGFLAEGIRHIVTGYDHVLFLLCLLLPCVMRRTPQGWQPVAHVRQALFPVVAIVTAFTLAHSITLGLAAMKWIALPAWLIEPAIALTIVLAAIDNLRPIFRVGRGTITFVFGLVHGFGFAGVLGELELAGWDFAWALLQFNLGLEAGQLGIVLVFVGLLFLMRRHAAYPGWVIRSGSLAALAMGLWWLVERSADVRMLPI